MYSIIDLWRCYNKERTVNWMINFYFPFQVRNISPIENSNLPGFCSWSSWFSIQRMYLNSFHCFPIFFLKFVNQVIWLFQMFEEFMPTISHCFTCVWFPNWWKGRNYRLVSFENTSITSWNDGRRSVFGNGAPFIIVSCNFEVCLTSVNIAHKIT